MNLYIRYFQHETLVSSLEEARDFLLSTGEIEVTQSMLTDIANYLSNPKSYPLRYKVRPKVYFIMIKTAVDTLEQFKENNEKKKAMGEAPAPTPSRKELRSTALHAEALGWYEGTLIFKRVIPNPTTGKFQYCDTRFTAFVKCNSAHECYERIVQHLQERQDVDPRSQFPSAKGSNFIFKYHGTQLPDDLCLVEEEEVEA